MKRGRIAVVLLLGGYVLSYIALSSFGAYAPAAWGTAGVKWYAWAPVGFYEPTTGRWVHTPMRIIYAPLTFADDRLWHTHGHFPQDGDPTHPIELPNSERK